MNAWFRQSRRCVRIKNTHKSARIKKAVTTFAAGFGLVQRQIGMFNLKFYFQKVEFPQ